MTSVSVLHYDTSDLFVNKHASPKPSKFDSVLLSKWKNVHDSGQCKYILKTQCRRIPGKYGYVAQLNSQRLERRTPQSFHNVNMSFDSKKFNFTKIREHEILFQIIKKNGDIPIVNAMSDINENEGSMPQDLIVINVSPFAIGHVLVVPNLTECRPQVLTSHAIQLGIEIQCLSSQSNFFVVFNGMCANASVNHLHLHCYYFNIANDHEGSTEGSQGCVSNELIVQRNDHQFQALTKQCFVCHLPHMPAIMFQVLSSAEVSSTSTQVHLITDYFVQEDIAHNMFITKAPKILPECSCASDDTKAFDAVRIFLWPRRKVTGAKTENDLNVAVCELAGHAFLQPQLYETMTEEHLIKLLAKDALSASEFSRIVDKVADLIS